VSTSSGRVSSSRIVLEPLEARHADLLFEGLLDDRIYTHLDDDAITDLPSLRARYRRLQERRSPDGSQIWLNWAIRLVTDHSYVGYVQATIAPPGMAEVAYVVFPSHWGRGLASEAVTLMCDELEREHQVSHFFAHVEAENAASRRLLATLGFQCSAGTEGTLRYEKGPV
jgi:ribosomal-protein-alanine N-acetyltransferase